MKNFPRKAALGVGAAALALTGAGAAYAAGTYMSIGGNTTVGAVAYTATNSTAIAFNTNFGTKMTCTTASISGNVNRGTEVKTGNIIGRINSGTLSCSMPPFGLNVSMSGGNIVVAAEPTGAGADVPVTITGFHADFWYPSGGTCTFDATGTLGAVVKAGNGGVDGTIELKSAAFGTPDTGFTLTISNVVGCGGDWVNGDLLGAWDSNKVTGTPSRFTLDTTGVVSHG